MIDERPRSEGVQGIAPRGVLHLSHLDHQEIVLPQGPLRRIKVAVAALSLVGMGLGWVVLTATLLALASGLIPSTLTTGTLAGLMLVANVATVLVLTPIAGMLLQALGVEDRIVRLGPAWLELDHVRLSWDAVAQVERQPAWIDLILLDGSRVSVGEGLRPPALTWLEGLLRRSWRTARRRGCIDDGGHDALQELLQAHPGPPR